MRIHRELKPLHEALLAAGATVKVTGGNHLRYRLPNGTAITMPVTPSDWHGLRNARAAVRRALAGTS